MLVVAQREHRSRVSYEKEEERSPRLLVYPIGTKKSTMPPKVTKLRTSPVTVTAGKRKPTSMSEGKRESGVRSQEKRELVKSHHRTHQTKKMNENQHDRCLGLG